MMTYLVVLIVSFLGVYAGAILGFLAPKELKPGKNYFVGMMNTILVFAVVLLLYAYGAPLLLLALLGILLAVCLYMMTESTPINQIAFFLLGIALYFSTKSTDLFVGIAILIFLYGMPMGSLYVARHIKQSKSVLLSDILLKYFFYILVAIITHFVATKFGFGVV